MCPLMYSALTFMECNLKKHGLIHTGTDGIVHAHARALIPRQSKGVELCKDATTHSSVAMRVHSITMSGCGIFLPLQISSAI